MQICIGEAPATVAGTSVAPRRPLAGARVIIATHKPQVNPEYVRRAPQHNRGRQDVMVMVCQFLKIADDSADYGYEQRSARAMRYHHRMSVAVPVPPLTIFTLIGGAEPLRALVDRFYDLMDLAPEFAGLREMHPTVLDGSRDKLYSFLSGWSGGPDLYTERHGHPRLRARHLPYAIRIAERDQWLSCMVWAMEDVAVGPALQETLLQSFYKTADWMRNQAE